MSERKHFKSDSAHYVADACIVWCFDDRFSKLLEHFMQENQLSRVDLVKVAGGAKDLASPEQESNRAYILDQIAKSLKLHHTKNIALMAHAECGAYGGVADPIFYENELKKAQAVVMAAFPGTPTTLHFADFDGFSTIG